MQTIVKTSRNVKIHFKTFATDPHVNIRYNSPEGQELSELMPIRDVEMIEITEGDKLSIIIFQN